MHYLCPDLPFRLSLVSGIRIHTYVALKTISSVTSVGGTELSGTSSETAVFFSSGGFSNYFTRPLYQAADVRSYLSESSYATIYSGLFNTSGRAFPDVAAMALDVEIVFDGEFGTVDGTSCASPIFASVIALINDARARVGKGPLGFLNPFLYAHPEAFHDITTGRCFAFSSNGIRT